MPGHRASGGRTKTGETNMDRVHAIERDFGLCPNAYYTGQYATTSTLADAGIESDEAEWWALDDGEDAERVWLIRTGHQWRVATDQEYIAIFEHL